MREPESAVESERRSCSVSGATALDPAIGARFRPKALRPQSRFEWCDVCARRFVPSIDADTWPYQSAWTIVPLCSVTILAFANHAGAAEAISGQFSVVSCQCLAMPAGVS